MKIWKAAVIIFHKDAKDLYRPEWISHCLSSIYVQTYQNFDIFEVNYGNESYSLTSTKFFYHRPLPDHTYAMNYLVTKVFKKGYEVVFNVNLDDFYHPQRFERQLVYIDHGYDIASSYFYYINENDNIINQFGDHTLFQKEINGIASQEDIKYQLNRNNNIINNSGYCLTRKVWESYDTHGNLLRYRNNKPFEDLTLWKQVLTNNDLKIAILPEYLIFYRIHPTQICNRELSNRDYFKEPLIKRIGILLVATGKYKDFLPRTLQEIRKYFVPQYPKIFFLFIDSQEGIPDLSSYSHYITLIDRRGFPGDTLYRYNYFLLRQNDLIQMTDIVYYFDVDMGIPGIVDEQVFPTPQTPLIGTRHPGFHMKFSYTHPTGGSIDIKPESSAYVQPEKRINNYIAGGFNGGITYFFLEMSKKIKKNIEIDDNNEVIPRWHDESHLNWYYYHHPHLFKILPPDYCYPENCELGIPTIPRIVALSKDHQFYRQSEKYIGIKFMGGLGNLLFQVATTLAMGWDINLVPVFNLLTSEGRKKTYRGNIFSKIMRINYEKINFTEVPEKGFSYQSLDLLPEKNILLCGYFQSWKHFHHRREEILKKLNLEYKSVNKRYQEIINEHNKETISIHIRRTDYLKIPDFHNILPPEYYAKALEKFPPESTFVIFSDDLDYCRGLEIFQKLSHVYFVSGLQDYEDFILMSKCQNHIIANSSFSWWSAYIGGGRIIYPRRWFGNLGPKVVWEDLVFPEWEGIEIE